MGPWLTVLSILAQVELSYLAQKVSEFDRLSPYTWCVVGNCFSLQKEHETALRFFQVISWYDIVDDVDPCLEGRFQRTTKKVLHVSAKKVSLRVGH